MVLRARQLGPDGAEVLRADLVLVAAALQVQTSCYIGFSWNVHPSSPGV